MSHAFTEFVFLRDKRWQHIYLAGSTGCLTLTGCCGPLERMQHTMARDRVAERGAEMRSLAS